MDFFDPELGAHIETAGGSVGRDESERVGWLPGISQ